MGLTRVFEELRAAHDAGLAERYAIGGAVAATVYIEPADTEDVDVFVVMRAQVGSRLVTLEPLYSFLRKRGATVEGERLAIGGWLLQLLPPPTKLVEEALEQAVELEVEGVTVPVFTQEHLAAVALETGRLKDKVRLKQFVDSPTFDKSKFLDLVRRFDLSGRWDRAQALFKEHP